MRLQNCAFSRVGSPCLNLVLKFDQEDMRIGLRIKHHACRVTGVEQRRQPMHKSPGRKQTRQVAAVLPESLVSAEFRVFSQWGGDGIVQDLLSRINTGRKDFFELDVQNRFESTTRFLPVNENGACRMIDDDDADTQNIPNESIFWQDELKPKCVFFAVDNVNTLISKSNIFNAVNLPSMKLAADDCWRREAIDAVQPVLPLATIYL